MIENVNTRSFPIRVKANPAVFQLDTQTKGTLMFVLAYRNDDGSLRIGPNAWESIVSAKAQAAYNSTIIHRTVTVLDLSSLLAGMDCICGKWVPAVNGAFANAEGLYCSHLCFVEAAYEAFHDAATTGGCSCGNCFDCCIGGCEACDKGVCPNHEGGMLNL